jgi:hypothetical protein
MPPGVSTSTHVSCKQQWQQQVHPAAYTRHHAVAVSYTTHNAPPPAAPFTPCPRHLFPPTPPPPPSHPHAQVSEHASWCINFYSRILEAALAAAGAPPGLVSFVTGYGDAGHALVTGGVDKVRGV